MESTKNFNQEWDDVCINHDFYYDNDDSSDEECPPSDCEFEDAGWVDSDEEYEKDDESEPTLGKVLTVMALGSMLISACII